MKRYGHEKQLTASTSIASWVRTLTVEVLLHLLVRPLKTVKNGAHRNGRDWRSLKRSKRRSLKRSKIMRRGVRASSSVSPALRRRGGGGSGAAEEAAERGRGRGRCRAAREPEPLGIVVVVAVIIKDIVALFLRLCLRLLLLRLLSL